MTETKKALSAVLLFLFGFIFAVESFYTPLYRTSTIANPTSKSSDYRLPTNILPISYYVTIHPKLESGTFEGSVVIEIVVRDDTNKIVLHNNGLSLHISNVEVWTLPLTNSTKLHVVEVQQSLSDNHFLTISTQEVLNAGVGYIVRILYFKGVLGTDNDGIYLGEYLVDVENELTRKFVTTQFEAVSARKAFPCFDEPEMKAKFQLSILRSADLDYHSVSNAKKVATIINDDGTYMDVYDITPPISSYLIAFALTDFKYVSMNNNSVYANPNAIDLGHAEYALKMGNVILNDIANYLNTPYGMKKLDQIAFPDEFFSAGAMENFGLVTYRESLLLFDSVVNNIKEKQSILNTIAHEYAHQWFGNLATPAWWKYLWLSEGFAVYLGNIAASSAEPSWGLTDQFAILSLHNALDKDSTNATRPMEIDVGSPRDISSLFDVISYDKGGSIIRMMEGMVTNEVFKNGLNRYLEIRKHLSVVPKDLYDAIQYYIPPNSDLPSSLSNIMQNWTEKAGYPLVSIKIIGPTVYFTQERFLTDGTEDTDDTVWTIPINAAYLNIHNFSDTTVTFWLNTTNSSKYYGDAISHSWFIANKLHMGFYRVNYDDELWVRITYLMNSDLYHVVHPINRAQLLDDAFVLAQVGRINYNIPLNLAKYLIQEKDYVPLHTAFKHLTFLDRVLREESNYYGIFESFVKPILKNLHSDLGSTNTSDDSHYNKLNRVNLLKWMAKFGDGEFLDHAFEKVNLWIINSEENPIIPDLQEVYFCATILAKSGYISYLLYLYGISTHESTRMNILKGVSCLNDEANLYGYYELAVDENFILPKDAYLVITSTFTNSKIGPDTFLKYLEEDYHNLEKFVPIERVLNVLANELTTMPQLIKLRELAVKFGQTEGAFKSALATVASNIEWNEKYLGSIKNWLDNQIN